MSTTARPAAPRPALLAVRGAAVVLLVALAGFVAMTLWVRGRTGELGVDHAIRIWLFEHVGTTGQQALLGLSEPALSIGVIVVVGAVALLLRRWDVAALAAIAPLAGLLLESYVLKPLIGRRLELVLDGHVFPASPAPGYAFPSGHETGLTSATALLALLLLRSSLSGRVKAAGLALLTAWTLLGALGLVRSLYHYATDTVGGMLLGVIVVTGIALVIEVVLSSPAGRDRTRTARAA